MAAKRGKDVTEEAVKVNGTAEGEAPFDPVREDDYSEMPELTRDQIFRADDHKIEVVAVPEWGGKVRVKALSGEERDKFEDSIYQTNKKGTREFNSRNMRAKLVALSCVKADGTRMFFDDDVRELTKKGAAPLERIFEVASRLSKISKEDEDELLKNSKEDPSGGLSSD